MINRTMIVVEVVSFTSGTDIYGERRKEVAQTREALMAINVATQRITQDIRYNEVEYIGLTRDQDITTANEIVVDGKHFAVVEVIPSSRFYQIFMKQV